jgi:DNA-binding XRE family transcriptional regulator
MKTAKTSETAPHRSRRKLEVNNEPVKLRSMKAMPANTTIHRSFVANIRARREELHLTQVDVAKALGWKPPQYARLEGGSHKVFLDTVEEIATVLQTTAAQLITPGTYKGPSKKMSA